MAKRTNSSVDPVLVELDAIKRLLIFGLMKEGATQRNIASALGVDQSKVSRMLAGGTAKASSESKKA